MKSDRLPELTALVVIDAQNAFFADAGSFARRGCHLNQRDELKQAILIAVRAFRQRRQPVICTKMEFAPGYAEAGLLVREKHPMIRDVGAYLRGSHDADLFEELKAELGDGVWVVPKSRYDAFLSPEFLSLVKTLGIHRFVVAGALTNVCVESFARSAFDRDFPVTVIADATTTYSPELQTATLKTLQAHFAEVVPLKEFLAAFPQ